MSRRPLSLPFIVACSFVLRRVPDFVLRSVLDENPIAFTFEFELGKLEQDGERVGDGSEGGEDVV